MKTTVNAIEMVKTAGVTTAGEIRLVLMDTRAITIDAIKEALNELMVVIPTGRPKKIELADLLARALEMDFDEEVDFENIEGTNNTPPATEDHPVAEQNNTEEESDMTAEQIIKEIVNKKNQLAIEVSLQRRGNKGNEHLLSTGNTVYENPAIGQMIAKVNGQKDAYINAIGADDVANGVVVEEIEFYATEAELKAEGLDSRSIRQLVQQKKVVRQIELANGNLMRFIGEVVVRMPEGFAQIKVWDKKKVNSKGKLGAPNFVDFVGYDANLVKRPYNMFQPLATGSGLVVLSIYEFEDANGEVTLPQVSLPTEKGTDGTRYPIFQTADIRYARTKDAEEQDMPLYLKDNNEQFNAQVSAFIQMFTNEFVQMNPKNHHGFNKTSCVNMVRFQTRDGVMDDEHMDSKKSRVILEQPDVMQLAQVGAEQPNTYCAVKNEWLDLDARLMLNDIDKQERAGAEGRDEEDDSFRFQRHDEVTVAGKLVKRNTVIDSAIESKCASCPFYCGNSAKSDAQVVKEKVENKEAGGNGYVSTFYRERPKAKAQAIQTLATINGVDKWVTKYPYELLGQVEDIKSVRVKSGGMAVYGSDNVMALFDPEYVVPVEEFDARHAQVMKQINQIFYAAFNFDKLDEAQHKLIAEMAKPEGLTADEDKRWENAVHWYEQSKGWAKDREAARNVKPFYQYFFAGSVDKKKVVFEYKIKGKTPFITRPVHMKEIHIEDIMADTLYRAETNQLGWGLGYEDLTPTEFVRYLDEVAVDYVYDVILNDVEFAIVGGTDKDKELCAGALQVMLQREINSVWTYGVRRDENPLEALLQLKVSDVVKGYIAEVIGLFK